MSNRCTIWLLDGTTVTDVHGPTALLDEEERRQEASYRDETARRSFVLRRSLAKNLLGASLGVPATAVQLTRQCAFCGHPSHGKPALLGRELTFSVSWSGPWVAIAIAPQGEIGLDIEMLRGCDPTPDQWAAVLGPSIRPADSSEQALLRTWTRKEAVLKCAGIGMAFSPDAVVVTQPDEPPAVVRIPERLGRPNGYRLYELGTEPTVVMSVAADRATDIDVCATSAPVSPL